MANNSTDFILQDPSTLNPLFVAQYSACAYPVSDFWADSPRYLYYVLLFLTIFVRWYGWLANVFLGVCATYAGIAAMEAFIILRAYKSPPPYQNVTIPYINSTATDATTLGLLQGNDTQDKVYNLATDFIELFITPYAYEYDTDALFAILVTGFLVMLPMHTWSSIVKRNRARHILMMIWNLLMLAGTICVIILWPKMLSAPYSFRFCYPGYLDKNQTTADGIFDESLWKGDWNTTIWDTFSNVSVGLGMSGSSCLNPCFRTSQIIRRPSTLISSIDVDRSYRTSITPTSSDDLVWTLANLIFIFIFVTIAVALVLLLFSLTPLKRYTRVPVSRPREFFTTARRKLFHAFWTDIRDGVPWFQNLIAPSGERSWVAFARSLRFWLDMLMVAILLFGSIATPVMIVCFIAWIEWWIHRDMVSDESPRQVGQWSTSVSLGLILISAAILELKYVLATTDEVDEEIRETKAKLKKLQRLRRGKAQQEEVKSRHKFQSRGQEFVLEGGGGYNPRSGVEMDEDGPSPPDVLQVPGFTHHHQNYNQYQQGKVYTKLTTVEKEDEISSTESPALMVNHSNVQASVRRKPVNR